MDKDKFSDDLVAIVSSIDITDIKTADMGESVKCLGDICTELLDEHAPLVSKRVSVIDTAPWFDNEYRD